MTNRDRAALALQCAASAKAHGCLDEFAHDLGFGKRVIALAVKAVSHVCTYGPSWNQKDWTDWWRETLADAEAALRCGEVE